MSAVAASLAVPALRVDDVHSRLNATCVARLARPRDIGELRGALAFARRDGLAVCPSGSRHAMGGQQFLAGGMLLDMRGLDRILEIDAARGTVRVEAGARWPEVFAALDAAAGPRRWAVRQKQTGADDFTLGGSVGANIHGRGLAYPPFVSDVESLVIVESDGRRFEASRSTEPERFAHAVGGYGLFGIVTEVVLRLVPRRMLERRVALVRAADLPQRFEAARAEGASHGDFQFAIDPASPDFLDLGVYSDYLPIDGDVAARTAPALSADAWRRLLLLAHVDKTRAFDEYAAHYLSTSGCRYASDAMQTGVYLDGYHADVDRCTGHRGSEMITELFVPRPALPRFLARAAETLRRTRADPIYGTVRLIERDTETALPWARERWACVVLNLHVRHEPAAVAAAAGTFSALIDDALAFGGSYYLTYHRWATAKQLEAAHPGIRAFLDAKRSFDPAGAWSSDWYHAMCAQLGVRA
jgi:FAD/FMN-containing dehydrogenase